MKFELRDYQQESVDACSEHLLDPSTPPGLAVLPTGSGKSLIIANTVRRVQGPTIVFQPSKEILVQNYHKYLSYGEHASIYSASAGRKNISEVVFATIGSVYKKPELFKEFKNIIIDECHGVNPNETKVKGGNPDEKKGGMYKEFLKAIGTRNVLGLTATPYRLGAARGGMMELRFLTRSRPSVFKKLVHYVQVKKLLEDGHLCPLEYHQLKNFDRAKVKMNSTGREFDDESLKQYYDSINFKDGVVKVVNRLLEKKPRGVLVFTRFVEEAQYMAARIPGAAYVTGKTPKKEREFIISQFKKGLIPAVCNVGVLTTGFDYPELDTVVIARPTMSLALYYQMVGRGMRTALWCGKTHAKIIDMCGNIAFFGHVEDLEICGGDTRTPYIKNKGGIITNVPIMRKI